MKLVIGALVALLVIAYFVFATQTKSFRCGFEAGAGQAKSQDCK